MVFAISKINISLVSASKVPKFINLKGFIKQLLQNAKIQINMNAQSYFRKHFLTLMYIYAKISLMQNV